MQSIIKKICLFSLITLLAGCSINTMSPYEPPHGANPEETNVPNEAQQPTVDWRAVAEPYVKQLLQQPYPRNANQLLIDQVSAPAGQANQALAAQQALQQLFTQQSSFVVLSNDGIAQARQALGLAASGNISHRNAITLARYLKADYVLFTALAVPQPKLDMQLISTQTGEIIWSSAN